MKYDFHGLIGRAARDIAKKDGGTAYALYELADNIAILLRGVCSVEEFKEAYSGWGNAAFLHDGLMPGEKGYETREANADAISEAPPPPITPKD